MAVKYFKEHIWPIFHVLIFYDVWKMSKESTEIFLQPVSYLICILFSCLVCFFLFLRFVQVRFFSPFVTSSLMVKFSNSTTAGPKPAMKKEGRTTKIILQNLKSRFLTWLNLIFRQLIISAGPATECIQVTRKKYGRIQNLARFFCKMIQILSEYCKQNGS